jgi:fatty-acyl-CoA synthase
VTAKPASVSRTSWIAPSILSADFARLGAEVEAVILTCPGVAQVAVIGVPDVRWGEVGIAFVEPQPGLNLEAAAVSAFLDGKLARFKLPKKVIVLDSLPRIGSGKIDKQVLKTLETR